MASPDSWKRMRLRYAGICRECGSRLGQGTTAYYDRADRRVVCTSCADSKAVDATVEFRTGLTNELVDVGTAGASARREYERRVANRERAVRERHPRLGGLLLAITDEPHSTTAWQTGGTGEQRMGAHLGRLTDRGVRVLHDRRIGRTRANIDHIAISPAGLFVIDTKRYRGQRPHLRTDGGILRERTVTLMIGNRRHDELVAGVHKQVEHVRGLVADDTMPVIGMLAFVDADWPLFGGSFTIRDVQVLGPKKAAEQILRPGLLTADQIDALHRHLARHLSPA